MNFLQNMAATACVIIIVPGCGGNDVIRPENVHNYKNNDITVCLKNGTRIFFNHDNYDVKESADGRIIFGKGAFLSDSNVSSRQEFSGNVKLEDIDRIEIAEKQGDLNFLLNLTMFLVLPATFIYLLYKGLSNMH